MAPLPHSSLPKVAQPRFGNNFDPWNSSASGHQRAEARGITSGIAWRDMRNRRLQDQYLGKTTKTNPQPGTRQPRMSVMEMLAKPGSMMPMPRTKTELDDKTEHQQDDKNEKEHNNEKEDKIRHDDNEKQTPMMATDKHDDSTAEPAEEQAAWDDDGWYTQQEMDELGCAIAIAQDQHDRPRQQEHRKKDTAAAPATPPKDDPDVGATTPKKRAIFDGLVIYVNGSTFPIISDHRLKQLLAEHGATMSSHVARRQVTHIILGRPNANGRGAGGGLAGAKLEKEIRRAGGRAIKYVNVEWYVGLSLSLLFVNCIPFLGIVA